MSGPVYYSLVLILVALTLELLTYSSRYFWRAKQVLGTMAVLLNAFSIGILLLTTPLSLALLLAVIGGYRIFNLLRLLRGRLNDVYLKKVSWRTSLALVPLQLSIYAIWSFLPAIDIKSDYIFLVLAALQSIISFLILYTVLKNRRLGHVRRLTPLEDTDLPALSIAIPARNETTDLEDCLKSILDNNYPKLEVLVFDDCSQNQAQLSAIIKNFAHAGVRFIKGKPPQNGWLAKNQAYEALADEATGKFILFCGVDTRFTSTSLRYLVSETVNRKLKMLSVLPSRSDKRLGDYIIQPMRYWWEVALPRWLFLQPAVLSTCWLIEAGVLRQLGGFGAVRQTIRPEGYFARHLNEHGDYSFFHVSNVLGVSSTKNWQSQFETAVRTRYPQLHKKPQRVAAVSLIELLFLLGPFILLPYMLISRNQVWHLVLVSVVLLIISHILIVVLSNKKAWFLALFNFPLVVLFEVFLINYSMWKYEFSEVYWKGRNICLPVLNAVPSLPTLNSVRK